jgi:NADH-quinone oxidoreductase subunit M
MTLLWLIALPVLGGVVALAVGRPAAARSIAMAALFAQLTLALSLFWGARPLFFAGLWAELDLPWFPALGIRFYLAADGLSAVLLVLTPALGLVATSASFTEITRRVPLFHANLLFSIAGVTGVFLAFDLFLLYFFWELMLVPMYLLIGIWGHERRLRAAIKFFLFTQASGLLMLAAIVGLAIAHQNQTGVLTFAYPTLLGTELGRSAEIWLMLGFFAAFAVKLPVVPVHTWLADAHTEAPTAGSVILAGLLLKTGAYGLLRFAVPLFPAASRDFAPIAMTLGVVGILYGALLALAQTDVKRLVAYTSVSHLGFVLLGIYSFDELAYQGALLQMVAHGLSTGGLFVLVGLLAERIGTRDLNRMGGLWAVFPRMGVVAVILAMASIGLPGLGNFVAEFLVLLGVFQRHPVHAAVAVVGLVLATAYALRMIQKSFHGPPAPASAAASRFSDMSPREIGILVVLIAGLLWLGLYPQPVIEAAAPALETLRLPVAPGGGA